jgi:hypothetical protein
MTADARGPVRWHCSMSLDGYVAGPGDDLSFLEHVTGDMSLIDRYVGETGAILAGRRAYDAYADGPSHEALWRSVERASVHADPPS